MTRISFKELNAADDDYRLPFGKYEGFLIEEPDSGYLIWVINNHEDEEIVDACETEMRYRDDHNGHWYTGEDD